MPSPTFIGWDINKLSALALEIPQLNLNPLPEYTRAHFDYGMTTDL